MQLHTGGKDKGEQKVSFNLKLMATKTQGAWKNESRIKTKVAVQQQTKVATQQQTKVATQQQNKVEK